MRRSVTGVTECDGSRRVATGHMTGRDGSRRVATGHMTGPASYRYTVDNSPCRPPSKASLPSSDMRVTSRHCTPGLVYFYKETDQFLSTIPDLQTSMYGLQCNQYTINLQSLITIVIDIPIGPPGRMAVPTMHTYAHNIPQSITHHENFPA